MVIDTTKQLETINHKPLMVDDKTPATLGWALAEMLIAFEAGGKSKMFILARKAIEEKKLEVDEADFGLIRKAVESSNFGGNLIGGQVELLLDEVKK